MISLRSYGLRDLAALHGLFSEEMFREASGADRRPFTGLWSFKRWLSEIFQLFYVIEENHPRKRPIIGFIGLYNLVLGKSTWISFGIFRTRDRGRRFGKEAVSLLLELLQEQGLVQKVFAEVIHSNTHSLTLLKRLGFQTVDTKQESFILLKHLV